MNNNDSNILNQVLKHLTGQEKYKVTKQLRTVAEFPAQVVANDSGYDIVTYYNTLSKYMVPAVQKLFKYVTEEIIAIGNSNVFTYNGKSIKEFTSYKDIESFFNENYSYSSVYSYIAPELTSKCLNTISKNNADIVNLYNLRQRKYNKDAYNKTIQYMSLDDNSKKCKVTKYTISAKNAILKK